MLTLNTVAYKAVLPLQNRGGQLFLQFLRAEENPTPALALGLAAAPIPLLEINSPPPNLIRQLEIHGVLRFGRPEYSSREVFHLARLFGYFFGMFSVFGGFGFHVSTAFYYLYCFFASLFEI